jgi:hypothetical protein
MVQSTSMTLPETAPARAFTKRRSFSNPFQEA